MTNEEIRAIVLKHLYELVPDAANREIPDGVMLDALGADSLDLVDVASRAMQELEVKLPRAAIAHIRTLDDLVEALQRCSATAQTDTGAAQAGAAAAQNGASDAHIDTAAAQAGETTSPAGAEA